MTTESWGINGEYPGAPNKRSFCHSRRHVENSLDDLAKQFRGKSAVIALDASAGETAEAVAEFAKQHKLTLHIALDPSGATADIFAARVTTTTVVIDKSGVLHYCGQFGDGQHAYAQEALRAVLAGEDVPVQETRQKRLTYRTHIIFVRG